MKFSNLASLIEIDLTIIFSHHPAVIEYVVCLFSRLHIKFLGRCTQKASS